MTGLEVLVVVGVLINVGGTTAYIARVVRGKNKPNRMSFLMWSIAPIIGAAASFAQGVTWAALPILFVGLCPFAVFVASFVNPEAYWELGRFDYLCGGLSALALILWWITSLPMIALVLAIVSDAFAGWPTLIKAWRHPDTESANGYVASMFSSATSFFVATPLNFASIAFPIYILCINMAITVGILRGRAHRRVI